MVNLYCDIEIKENKKCLKWFNKIFKAANQYLNLSNERLVDVTIVGEKEIQDINKQYRNNDKVTDVISFAFDESNAISNSPVVGEMYICYQKAIDQAKEYGHSLKRELCFLFCHGLLHLYGYDHMEEAQAEQMFKLQDIILDKCKIYRERT